MDHSLVLAALESDVLAASPLLLGMHLVRAERRARIVEVEAYRSLDDPACHAYRCRSERNEVMYGAAGRAYVYFSYGVHWMLNVVAHGQDDAAAILVRAAIPLAGIEKMRELRPKARKDEDLLSGPGKICAAFGITRADNGVDLFDPHSDLRLEEGGRAEVIVTGPRIGITKAVELPWRFMDAESMRWVSKPRP